jgi:indole-3-glycerol phosphate synthase
MTPAAASADLLATIVAATRRIVAVRESRESFDALASRAEARIVRPRAFRAALARTDRTNIIAECKRRSPSRGVLRADYDPVAIARSYEAAGAAAISVLTEPTFFDGALDHLIAVRAAVTTPLLRKDFIVSEYQLLEARAAGADAVLLIVAALTDHELSRLSAAARDLGLDALVEVHDEVELEAALAAGADLVGVNNRDLRSFEVDAGAEIVGVNNRNLRTLTVDVEASERVIANMPSHVIAVSESGLKSAADIARLNARGFRAFLIGERFMTAPDPGAPLASLLAVRP